MSLPAPAADTPFSTEELQKLRALLAAWKFEEARDQVAGKLAGAPLPHQRVLQTLHLNLQRLTSTGGVELPQVVDSLRAIELLEAGPCAPLLDWLFSDVGFDVGAQGRLELGIRWLNRSIQGSRQRQDRDQLARALGNLAALMQMAGAPAQAARLHQEELALTEDSDPNHVITLNNAAACLIRVAYDTPASAQAQRQSLGEQALRLAREAIATGDPPMLPWHRGWSLANAGHALSVLERHEEAQQMFLQSLPLCGDHLDLRAGVMASMANLLVELGRPAEAQGWLDEALALGPEASIAQSLDDILAAQVRVMSALGRFDEALQWSQRRYEHASTLYDERLKHAISDELQTELERARVAEQAAQARAKALDAASAAKSAFVAHMSHEIRTPIHAVLGLAQLLSDEPLSEAKSEKVRGIVEAGESLLHIVNDILDLSKIEAGRMPLDRAPMALPALLRRVKRMLRPAAQGKGLALQVQADALSATPLLGDAAKLEQVLVNLVGNAVKFTRKGRVAVQATALPAAEGTLRLRLEVTDTGTGIPPEVLARLFTPFTQADTRINREYGGTGLGLAISRRLVNLMGGEISAVSTPGQGSTFWCEIPMEIATQHPLPPPPEEHRPPERAGPRLQGLRVLAADDNRLNRLVIQRQLEREGAQVQLAEDGLQALQRLRAQPKAFDVVILDLQMPVLDGLSALRALRTDPALARLPAIALSAGVLTEDRDTALAAGADLFVAKPVDLEQLVTVLRPYLARAHAPG